MGKNNDTKVLFETDIEREEYCTEAIWEGNLKVKIEEKLS
jgi:hypothetical protein